LSGDGKDLEAGSGNRYGSYVDTDELSLALDRTRLVRLALNVLYDRLDEVYHEPTEPQAIDRARETLDQVHDHLSAAETRALTQHGFAEHYVVIRPFSPARLPGEGAMKEITTAVRALRRHGMLVQAPDAGDRDD
jgi:hypothetical protein